MLPMAVATSIDALAVGITFRLFEVNIITAVSAIGVISFISALGIKIGSIFGCRFKAKDRTIRRRHTYPSWTENSS